MADIKAVGVVGLGTMGAGIAEVFAAAGLSVVAVEADRPALDRGWANLTRSTDRAVSRGKLTAEAQQALFARITFTTDLSALATAEFVIEAIPEQLPLKRELFARLDEICPPQTIFATNTSSLSVTEIAASTGRAGQVVGMHFFNPAPVMKLVEVIRGIRTDPAVVAAAEQLAQQLGKTTVTAGDRAGFVVNALLLGYLNRAASLFESGYASREDIDTAMRVGAGFPMGPLTLLDLVGLDTTVHVLNTMYAQSGNRLHAPAPVLRALVAAGFLGRKSGRGFYTYEAPGSATVTDPAPASPGVAVSRVGVVGADDLVPLLGGFDVRVGGVAEMSDRELILAGADADWAALGATDAVLAATGSSPVLEVAMASGRPQDVVGLHRVGDLFEVVATVASGERAIAVARGIGEPSVLAPDRPGFLVDALLQPHLGDAVRMLESGYATVVDIDTAMRLGCGYPAGPFQLLDRIGLADALAVQQAIYADTPEPGLMPAPLLRQSVAAGRTTLS
jgi:3-hydroxybutyryl-CoA dehydrogenase